MAEVNLLLEIETLLGEIETWPSEITKLIFVEEYDRQNVFQVQYHFSTEKRLCGLRFEILFKM